MVSKPFCLAKTLDHPFLQKNRMMAFGDKTADNSLEIFDPISCVQQAGFGEELQQLLRSLIQNLL